MDYRKEYERWMKQVAMDEDIVEELRSMDDVKMEDAFYRDLAFGTGGLRGVIGAGTNRINIYTIAKASQGLADYLKKNFEEPSVAIGYDSRIKSDAAIAMISASSLAIGIIVTSLTTGMTTDVSSYMFGSILAMTKEDVALSAVLCIIVLGLFVLCYNQVFAVTFDENFAKATGVNVGAYNMLISVLTAVTIVLGMRMMGAMLISSLVIFPCLTSMRVFKSFTSVVISSGILSLVCFLLGMMASYQFSTPAGASVVVVNLIAFGLFSMWQVLGRKR